MCVLENAPCLKKLLLGHLHNEELYALENQSTKRVPCNGVQKGGAKGVSGVTCFSSRCSLVFTLTIMFSKIFVEDLLFFLGLPAACNLTCVLGGSRSMSNVGSTCWTSAASA